MAQKKRFRYFFPIFIFLAVFLFAGCRPQGQNEGLPERERPRQGVGAEEILGENYMQKLQEEGVYIISVGTGTTEEPALNIMGHGMDQRSIGIIKDMMVQDHPLEVQEAVENLLVEGAITQIETNEDGMVRQIFVEGEDGSAAAESAHVFIAEYTRILREEAGHQAAYDASVLSKGQNVRVDVVGIVLTSLPPQADASTITILSD